MAPLLAVKPVLGLLTAGGVGFAAGNWFAEGWLKWLIILIIVVVVFSAMKKAGVFK